MKMKMSKPVVGALIRLLLLCNKDENFVTEPNHMVVYLNPPNLFSYRTFLMPSLSFLQ